ncbi:hypothetical protein LO772_07535 [Yinghuangia sp. ASG 101]|uniref:hypothetical protein n=1 Tax=Yinghuangia sp. ASG 101 TaxID=2896848 RepID=UPI001E60471A|nr:hypothetical protein [Yinghuangia sp. ASG 101]UGQ13452.1 hypothetical protein LO772_07535 [Yinghuangia sp. ASG 101]
MDPAVVALASSGATTLVGAMATDAWTQARDRFAAWFGRGSAGQAEAVARELEADRAAMVAADDDGDTTLAADIAAEWRGRLRRLLAADPAVARELEDLIAEFAPGTVNEAVHNTVSGGSQQVVLQGRDVRGNTVNSVHNAAPSPSARPHTG